VKRLGDIIAIGFIVLIIFTLLSGLFSLLGFDSPVNIEENHNSFTEYAYDNWIAVLLGIGLFSFFTLSFLVPVKKREWRTVGVYEAFIIALFTEMYGFPLTIFILSSVFGLKLSFGHVQGHLLALLIAQKGIMSMESAWKLVMTISTTLIFFGFFLMAKGWSRIHVAKGDLVIDGIYRYVRHPQYLGLMIITLGMLIQWPTIITLAMWPVLIVMYYRLARKEEKEAIQVFGERYVDYMQRTPMFLPSIKKLLFCAKLFILKLHNLIYG